MKSGSDTTGPQNGECDLPRQDNGCASSVMRCTARVPGTARACAAPSAFTQGTLTRDYSAECGVGQHPKWQLFNFHLTTEGNSKITFTAQSAQKQGDLAATVVTLAESTDTRVSPTAPAFFDVGSILKAAGVSRHYGHVRIEMTLVPSTDGAHAPILHDWEMRYTCEDGDLYAIATHGPLRRLVAVGYRHPHR